MNWNCPHCGVTLAISEAQLGTGWSFSRCYKCGGFALVRRAEINVIKVDKAPPGERVLLPERSVDPLVGSLNKEATDKLTRHMPKTSIPIGDLIPPRFPDPLPEVVTQSQYTRFIPVGIISAACLALISGGYLIFHGSNIHASNAGRTNVALNNITNEPAQVIITDRVQQTANAPLKVLEPMPEDLAVQKPRAPVQASAQGQVLALSANTPIASLGAVATGAVAKNPARAADTNLSKLDSAKATLQVSSINRIVNIHSGPGLHFPVIAKTDPKMRYEVADWSDRWLKVVIDQAKKDPKKSPHVANLGWIQNNLVKVIPDAIP